MTKPFEVVIAEEDEEILDYLDLALTGFSRGTANVTPADRHKLLPILRHYAKDPHPFTSCVRDNRKRFGPRADAICAVVKDLIVGNTHWRGKGKPYVPRALAASEQDNKAFVEAQRDYELKNVPEIFYQWLAETELPYFEEYAMQLAAPPKPAATKPDQGAGPAATSGTADDSAQDGSQNVPGPGGIELPPTSANYRSAADPAQSCASCSYFQAHPAGDDGFCSKFNCSSDSEYVSDAWESKEPSAEQQPGAPPATGGGAGAPASQSYATMAEGIGLKAGGVLGELFMADGAVEDAEEGIWKTIAKVGEWKFSPGKGQKPIPRPLSFKLDGETYVGSDRIDVSLGEVMRNYAAGAIQHVTIPVSHDDGTLDNTGFVKELRLKGEELQARMAFTEPDVDGKVRRGTIPNVSAGLLFDYIKKDDGTKFKVVLGHVALTPKPWLNGMKPFGVEASEGPLEVLGLTEHTRGDGGGDNVMTTITEELGLTEEQVRARLALADRLEKKDRDASIEAKVTEWEGKKLPPAQIAEARRIMLADNGSGELLLSEDGGNEIRLSTTDVVERLMGLAAPLDLSEDKSKGAGKTETEGAIPDEDTVIENADLTDEQKTEALRLFLYEQKSKADAIKLAKEKFPVNKPDDAS